ncbi:MAG TPA: hypothetical protein VMR28_03340 [Candidatus Saccharimonadales bacterium]|nr:hypothetical protein [Candidatus Saccharimonadales bacterium]
MVNTQTPRDIGGFEGNGLPDELPLPLTEVHEGMEVAVRETPLGPSRGAGRSTEYIATVACVYLGTNTVHVRRPDTKRPFDDSITIVPLGSRLVDRYPDPTGPRGGKKPPVGDFVVKSLFRPRP